MLSCGLLLLRSTTKSKLHETAETVNIHILSQENTEVNTDKNCPRCGEGRLQVWSDLDDDEQEVVRRLPQARHYVLEDRQAMHSWCTRCWYESTRNEAQA